MLNYWDRGICYKLFESQKYSSDISFFSLYRCDLNLEIYYGLPFWFVEKRREEKRKLRPRCSYTGYHRKILPLGSTPANIVISLVVVGLIPTSLSLCTSAHKTSQPSCFASFGWIVGHSASIFPQSLLMNRGVSACGRLIPRLCVI